MASRKGGGWDVQEGPSQSNEDEEMLDVNDEVEDSEATEEDLEMNNVKEDQLDGVSDDGDASDDDDRPLDLSDAPLPKWKYVYKTLRWIPSINAPEFLRAPSLYKTKKTKGGLNYDLPPITSIEDVFEDICERSRAHGLEDLLDQLNGRSVRVGTMCSGTECPLMALDLVQKHLARKGQNFQWQHSYSCEIVPFKQSYIERNFAPPVLFRDITQMSGDEAQTAYGSWQPIPKDIDLVIAGTACVDFSSLNSAPKTREEMGESGTTIEAMFDYAKKYQPNLVLLENVVQAPWDDLKEEWNDIGYYADYVRMDTKRYYLPQTRNRIYMACIRKAWLDEAGVNSEWALETWKKTVIDLERPASSAAGDFLLDETDPRLEPLMNSMMGNIHGPDKRRKPTTWELLKVIHAHERNKRKTGPTRPLSRSKPGQLSCNPPDYFWRKWFQSHVERIWESYDIKYLTCIVLGFDPLYKEQYYDFSQNVVRINTTIRSLGILVCQTSGSAIFITLRGGPLTGLEALALQGLPIDRIVVGRETEKKLQDLAGNAMSSTTVGVASLGLLIAVREALGKGKKYEQVQENRIEKKFAFGNDHIMEPIKIEESHLYAPARAAMVRDSRLSMRYCDCEKQSRTSDEILICALCSHTVCNSCAGNPTHEYKNLVLERESPENFITSLKKNLPMRLSISGLNRRDFEEYYSFIEGFKCIASYRPLAMRKSEEDWSSFNRSVDLAVGDDVRFSSIQRGRIWTVTYEGDHSTLRLEINGKSAEWLWFVKPPKDSAVGSLLRTMLMKPVARMSPTTTLSFDGQWHIVSPFHARFDLEFQGLGEKVPTPEAKLGIKVKALGRSEMWSKLNVTINGDAVNESDRVLEGVYDYLPECGTAEGTLYRKESKKGGTVPPVYLFLDPGKTTHPSVDSYVFAFEHERIFGYEHRQTIAEVECSWGAKILPDNIQKDEEVEGLVAEKKKLRERLLAEGLAYESKLQNCEDQKEKVELHRREERRKKKLRTTYKPEYLTAEEKSLKIQIYRQFSATAKGYSRPFKIAPRMVLRPLSISDISYHVCNDQHVVALRSDGCRDAYIPIVGFSTPRESIGLREIIHDWETIIPDRLPAVFKKNAWATQKLSLAPKFQEWRDIVIDGVDLHHDSECPTCNSVPPRVLWLPTRSGRSRVPWEDPVQAADYEKTMKTRPPPFLVFQKTNTESKAEIAIALNIQTMAHRVAKTSLRVPGSGTPLLEWRLLLPVSDTGKPIPTGFVLPNNKNDEPHPHPTLWNPSLPLRTDQLRSLAWMISQEADDVEPFGEVEVEEAMLPAMNWRAEVRATRPRFIRGGLIADEVGYGKTALALSLVATGLGDKQYEPPDTGRKRRPKLEKTKNLDYGDIEGHISTNATIILVPLSVHAQWQSELGKFLGKGVNVLSSSNAGGVYSWSVREVKEADIILATWPMMQSLPYYNWLGAYTVSPAVPEFYSDMIREWFEDAREKCKSMTEILKTEGREAYVRKAEEGIEILNNKPDDLDVIPSKRLRGAQFTAAREQKEKEEEESRNSTSQDSRSRKWRWEKEIITMEKLRKRVFPKKFTSEEFIDLQEMRIPLHAFHFKRMIIDEYTYVLPKQRLFGFSTLSARNRWVISGTPGLEKFGDIQNIATLLGVNLGVIDGRDGEIKPHKGFVALDSDGFKSTINIHSDAWYIDRHRYGQEFLNRFARQNQAQIDNIERMEQLVLSHQYPRERQVYEELHKQLVAHPGWIIQNLDRRGEPLIDHVNKMLDINKVQGPFHVFAKATTSTDVHDEVFSIEYCQEELADKEQAAEKEFSLKLVPLLMQRHVIFKSLAIARSNRSPWKDMMDVENCEFGDEGAMRIVKKFISKKLPGMIEKFEKESLEETSGTKKKPTKKHQTLRKVANLEDLTMRLTERIRKDIGERSSIPWMRLFDEGKWYADEIDDIGKGKGKEKEEEEEQKTQETEDIEMIETPETTETQVAAGSKRKAPDTRLNARKRSKKNQISKSREELERTKRDRVAERLITEISRVITNFIVPTQRQLRFSRAMMALLNVSPESGIFCKSCNSVKTHSKDLSVIENCGHTLCNDCAENVRTDQDMTKCPIKGCSGEEYWPRTIRGSEIGTRKFEESAKIDKLVELINSTPPDDHVIVFVPAQDCLPSIEHRFDAANITYRSLTLSRRSRLREFLEQRLYPTFEAYAYSRAVRNYDEMEEEDEEVDNVEVENWLEGLGSSEDEDMESVNPDIQPQGIALPIRLKKRQLESPAPESSSKKKKTGTSSNTDEVMGGPSVEKPPATKTRTKLQYTKKKWEYSEPHFWKVVLLPIGGVVAAGLNLQIANHIVFMSPFPSKDQVGYDSQMTQAIGRARRYGQKKPVHIYHMVARNTMDVDYLEKRLTKGRRIVERDGQACVVEEHEIRPTDVRLGGPPMEGLEDLLV